MSIAGCDSVQRGRERLLECVSINEKYGRMREKQRVAVNAQLPCIDPSFRNSSLSVCNNADMYSSSFTSAMTPHGLLYFVPMAWRLEQSGLQSQNMSCYQKFPVLVRACSCQQPLLRLPLPHRQKDKNGGSSQIKI